jgi:F-type H+-transporting ATPase subunit b
MLDLNISLFAVSALIGVLMVILNRIYFKPVGQVLEERERKKEKESALIEANTIKINEKKEHLESILKQAELDVLDIKEDAIKKGEADREQTISAARLKAREMVDERMKQLDREIEDAEEKLKQEVGIFSDMIKELFLSA